MVGLDNNDLVFRFPEVHPEAMMKISFRKMDRLPESEKVYNIYRPSEKYPLAHVDDFKETINPDWVDHGGVMLPMYQGEAVRVNALSRYLEDDMKEYPFALKIGCGKINAVTGEDFDNDLQCGQNQNYISVSEERDIDGYFAKDGYVRQFTAVELNTGLTPEEFFKGKAQYGGIQIQVYPLKKESFNRYLEKIKNVEYSRRSIFFQKQETGFGLAPGEIIRKKIYHDSFSADDWDSENTSRCFVHILNSELWKQLTGQDVPGSKPKKEDFVRMSIPWNDIYDEK